MKLVSTAILLAHSVTAHIAMERKRRRRASWTCDTALKFTVVPNTLGITLLTKGSSD